MCKWEEGKSATATGPFPTPVTPTLRVGGTASIYLFKDFSFFLLVCKASFQLDQHLGLADGRAARSGGHISHRSQDGAGRQGQATPLQWYCLRSASTDGETMLPMLLYVNNPRLGGQMHSKTSGPVHDGSWSVGGYRVWGPHSKCASHPTVLSLMWGEGFHTG